MSAAAAPAPPGGADPLVGQVVAGSYRITRPLDAGGMGVVYAAQHLRLPQQVAVKVLRRTSGDDELARRFRREAESLTRVRHPNVVRVLDHGELPPHGLYLVMELLDGPDLAARLRAGPLPLAEVFALARALGGALSAVHAAGVVHRDIKPRNVVLCLERRVGGAVAVPGLVDFGICGHRGATEVLERTGEGVLLGTPRYMAPEQVQGRAQDIGAATDQWALAALLVECLQGRPLFLGDDLSALFAAILTQEPRWDAAGLPRSSAAALRRALSRDPAQRFPDIEAFCAAFVPSGGMAEPVLAPFPATAALTPVTLSLPAGEVPAPLRTPRAQPALLALLLLVSTVLVGLGLAWRGRSSTPLVARPLAGPPRLGQPSPVLPSLVAPPPLVVPPPVALSATRAPPSSPSRPSVRGSSEAALGVRRREPDPRRRDQRDGTPAARTAPITPGRSAAVTPRPQMADIDERELENAR